MKNLLKCISVLLIIAGLNNELNAQPQYYNYNIDGSANSFPLGIAAGKQVELLYLPGDFNTPAPAPAGTITSVSFRINSTYPITNFVYTTFTIALGQSAITTLPTGAYYAGSMTTVYNHASVTFNAAGGTWLTIPLDTPFPYDPTQSLIIDMGLCSSTNATGFPMCFTTLTNMRRTWSTGGCPFVYGGQNGAIYHFGLNLSVAGPPIVVTTAATVITGTSATLNGTVNANGNNTTVSFNYGLTAAYGSTIAGVPVTVTGNTVTNVSAAISGLANNTTYHYQVVGVNSSGTMNGNDMTFTTLGPPPTVVTTAATGIGLTTATVNGTINANSASTAVTFQYGLTVAYGSTVAGVPSPVTGNTVTNVSAALAGLLANTTYHYRVVGVNTGGTSNGNDMTFTTAGPPIVVTNPATNIGNTTATLNGTVTANNLSTAVSFNYGLTVAYGSVAPGVPSPVTGNTATPVLANITGLTYNVTYHYQCVGVNAGGTTYGNDQTFQTGCTPPPAPGGISGPVNVCQGACGYVYSIASIPTATSYTWTVPVGATITSGQGTTSISVCYTPTALYGFVTVAGIGSCGNGPAGSLTINVYSAPVPTITGPATVCQGSTGNVYMTQYGYSNYTWTVSGGTITAGQGTYAATVTWNTSGAHTISVNYANFNGCSAQNPTVYNVTVNAIPTPTITGLTNMCVNSGVYLYTTQTGFTNYTWTVSTGGTITSGQGTNSVYVNWNTAGSQNVSVNYSTANGCTALNPTNYVVTVNPVPGVAGTITGTATVCAGTTGITYSVAPIQNAANYVWTLPAGASNASGSLTNSITVDFAANAASGNITVYGNNICGNGTVSPAFPVTINPVPGAAGAITGQASVCVGEMSVAYSVPAIANATGYTWTVPAGATISSGANTNSILVDFGSSAVSGNITVLGVNTCGNGTVSPNFAVAVHPIPPTPSITVNGNTLASNATSGNQWYFEGTLIPGANAQTYTAVQSGWYWTAVTLSGCTSDTSNHIYLVMVGLDKQDAPGVTIIPVPNDGQFTVSITSHSQENFTIQVFNNLGAMIREVPGIEVNGKVDQVIDLRPIADGIYTVAIRNSNTRVVKQIIVKK